MFDTIVLRTLNQLKKHFCRHLYSGRRCLKCGKDFWEDYPELREAELDKDWS